MPGDQNQIMHDEDQDLLAAEYVLGTLSAEEREQAEALRSFDPGFEAAVRHWERRLGELNVMVEAVEPPAETWEKIKSGMGPVAPAEGLDWLQGHEAPPPLPRAAPFDLDALAPPHLPGLPELPTLPLPPPIEPSPALAPGAGAAPAVKLPPPEPAGVEPVTTRPAGVQNAAGRSADVVYLAKRVRRWQRGTLAFAAIAALLALYVAAGLMAPNLVPLKMRLPAGGQLMTQAEPSAAASGRAQQDRLVAVLQQGPTAPAFLVTVDTQQRKLFVRRVSASAEGNKSYELWLISTRFPAPRSLGVVGTEDFTQRALPANFDTETLQGATYAVSLEPAGGSKTGAPTGPVLFTGKAVESLPSSAPATPKT